MGNFDKRTWRAIVLLLALLLVATACAGESIEAPVETGDGWSVGKLDEACLDTGRIAQALRRIGGGDYGEVHSLLIVKDDRLVLEEYFPGHAWVYDADNFHGPYVEFDRDTLHTTMSITKAITSAAVGVAIEQGAIGSEEDPVS